MTRVLLVSNDGIGRQMAGPGIRYRQFALQLAKEHDVSLMIPNETSESLDGVRVLHAKDYGYRRFTRLCRTVDVIVTQQLSIGAMEHLARGQTRTIFDLYDPILFEALGFYGGQQTSTASARQLSHAAILKQVLALHTGSAFICASERQRDLWLGVLGAIGRIDLDRFRRDPSLDKLVGVVPFGLEAEEPRATKRVLKGVVPGIGEDDKVLLWGGGIWNWLDPLTPIKAVAELSRRRRDVKLFFLGVQHPNPRVPAMVMTNRAVELAESLGVRGTSVFFNFGWTPYAERAGFLLEADAGISAHFDSVETRFAFRTRILDYFWAGLPTVATGGDVLGDLIEEEGLGRTVNEGDVEGWIEAIEGQLEDGKTNVGFEDVRSRFAWPTVVEPLSAMINGELPAPRYPAKVLPVLGSYLWSGFFGTLRSRGVHGTLSEIAMVLRRPNVP
jgi:glycosyltransferase involved in cell wall biosynthesis